MTAQTAPPIASAAPRLERRLVRRHSLVVRITHWINAVSLILLLMSGLQIFNAHAALYWGKKSTFAAPWLSIHAEPGAGGLRGVVQLGSTKFDTTGVLGLSTYKDAPDQRAFPAWATLPQQRYLADARRWHLMFAWIFGISVLVYVLNGLVRGHLRRDIAPTLADLRHIPADIVDHLRLRFPKGWAATRYNVLQKIAYLGVGFIVLPLMILTGLTMSPGINAALPWLLDLVGGRQSGRSLHFLGATLIVLFILVHLAMVLLSGPINQLRGIITGRYAIDVPEGEEAPR